MGLEWMISHDFLLENETVANAIELLAQQTD
jgi:hypothetical protein